MVFHLRFGLDK